MKNIKKLFFIGFIFISSLAQAQFITTWKTDNDGPSNDDQITIPTTTGVVYNYTVNWGDGSPNDTGVSGPITHTYAVAGTYTVTITGTFPRIYFNAGSFFGDDTDHDKILTIEQWGTGNWTSMQSAFSGCSNLNITATDAPDLFLAYDLTEMFRGCSSLDADLSSWNAEVNNVESFNGMFWDATAFNGNITGWDVSGAEEMDKMFLFASNFNQDIGGWHTENVNTMASMFAGATVFNQDINTVAINGTWNTSNVSDMDQMFAGTENFNQDIGNWDVSKVTNMRSMFASAHVFNKDISGWDISKVTNLSGMFNDATAFNQNISAWDVSNVTNMNSMFANTTFNPNISGWDVSNVNDFNSMFSDNTSFNQNISGWVTSSANDFRGMFSGASTFNQNLGGWDISNIFSNKMSSMLNNSGLSVDNYDNTLIGWAGQNRVNPNVSLGASGLFYCAGEAARSILTSAPNNWFITDKGVGCIKVYEGADTSGPEILNGQPEVIDFGSINMGGTKSLSFTIENNLAANITNFNVLISTITGTAFSISPPPPTTISPSSPLVITIDFTGLTTATFSETVTLNFNPIPGLANTFVFDITGVVTTNPEPEIKVFKGPNPFGTEIIDGDVTGYYIGDDLRGNNVTNKITILNNGSADLTINTLSTTGAAFSLVPNPPIATPFIIPVDGSYTIDITLNGNTAGVFSETLTITNDDGDENPFDFVIKGEIFGPDLAVIDGTNIFTDPQIFSGQGAIIDFKSSLLGVDTTRTISLLNNGPVDLTVSNITVASPFIIIPPSVFPLTIPALVDGNAGIATIGITLLATTAGDFNEPIAIISDDDLKPSFDFSLVGTIIDPNAPKIYWTEETGNQINRSNLDGSSFEQYHTIDNNEPFAPRGIVIDTLNKVLYWTNEWGQIKKGDISASGLTNVGYFLNDGIDIPREMGGIALDVAGDKIYWASTYDGAIKSANLSSPDPFSVTTTTIVPGLERPLGIALDLVANKIFYSENIDGSATTMSFYAELHQVNIDGTGDITEYTLDITYETSAINDVKLDLSSNMIYWSSTSSDATEGNRIYSSNISNIGGSVISFTTMGEPVGIDLDITNGKIYWIDALLPSTKPAEIIRANFDGTSKEILHSGVPNISLPLYLALDIAQPVAAICANPPTANAGADQTICGTDVITLNGTTGGSTSSITWTTTGNGAFSDDSDSTTPYNLTAADRTNGLITFTITTNDPDGTGPCVAATDDMVVTIEKIHVVDAGTDQSICPSDSVNLMGSVNDSSIAATWSTSGNGSFNDASLLDATYTASTNDISNGSVTLTLTSVATTCSSVSDQIVITINQSIAAVNQAASLKVGETTSINLLNGSVINSGDAITYALITQPQKGTANLNADGTLDYTATTGNVGQDSFEFQLINQCNQFATAFVNITIENDAPQFVDGNATATPGSPVTINIINLISDSNGNIDLSSIRIIQQPGSGATATLDANNNLVVDYTGIVFFGTDEVIIEVCDFDGACTEAVILIEVVALPIKAFNAVSPNGDGKHDFLEFEYIEAYPNNEVVIFNRWGDTVFSIKEYNNQGNIFIGNSNRGGNNELPAGTYYYSVYLKDTNETVNGFFELRR